ncbi:hypothetical protein [Vibrio algarum]|uniref:Uncharacterized protein n=1 Tax=Vibrio algarum TaxID=3020714 RepID=A0ABT4YRX8_9VIBR|nr:hypothetical protein [Vibrio sp. KJ40-1]MDB1124294.1 hypothetical protein [Vibrio sp. KJ40-1]
MRKIGTVVIFMVILVIIFRWANEDKRYYCGLLDGKPKLYMGLEPTWFDSTLQFNIRYTPYLITGTWKNDFRGDPYVSGSEQFSLIVAYADYSDGGLIFKGINRKGSISTYRYQYKIDEYNKKIQEK